ncbi:MAG: adenosylhomocysteinase [Myxococcota bacterium]|jgi:adenosylhomocysteinase
MSEDRSVRAMREIGRINAFFPILPALGNRWAAKRPWEGRTVALNLHLTTLTAGLVRELTLGGGTWVVSAANPHTTDPGAVDLLRNHGLTVYTGGDLEDRHGQVLAHEPSLLVDVGFDLIARAADRGAPVTAAVEITRSGITRLRKHPGLPFPVVNLNDGRLKDKVENRHGVGEALWQAVARLTGMHLAGRRVLLIGYGAVGRGIAAYARAAGCSVEVVERDPIRRLFAHYDGYPTPNLQRGLSSASVVVTATGAAGSLPVSALRGARDGVVLVNAGHGGDEIDVAGIEEHADSRDDIAPQVETWHLPGGPSVTLLGHGHPLNIVLNSGSPEPVLLHFGLLGLTLEWLTTQRGLSPGELVVPEALERTAAEHALGALGASPA